MILPARSNDGNNDSSTSVTMLGGGPKITVDSTLETSFREDSNVKLAVRARNICLTYGSGAKSNYVLNNLSLSVPAGGIYGLLGPSGCGKTSLLKIISGLMRPDSGLVRVFGFKPGSSGSGVPGSGIGYMPQDIALQSDLTVEEMLSYFGSLYFMPKPVLRKQINDLVELLEIPDKKRFVARMSGGQQRRLSLACTIIHKPRLAILDEPTVGVDPILCSRIWSLLNNLSTEYNMTIMITTHYIEECRKAAVVGFMRKGEILEEDEPERLIKRFDAGNLEEVFYKICMAQKRRNTIVKLGLEHRKSLAVAMHGDNRNDFIQPYKSRRDTHPLQSSLTSIHILIWRYLIQAIRSPSFLALLFLFPISAMGFLHICVGGSPKDLPVAYIVEETPEYGILHARPENYSQAYSKYLTPFYPDVLKESIDKDIVNLIRYDSLDKALADIKTLKLGAALHMKRGFSDAFHERINPFNSKDLDDGTIDRGTIWMYGDMADKFFVTTVELSVQLAMLKLMNVTASAANLPPESRTLPLQLGAPVYGKLFQKDSFGLQDYAAPGFMVAILNGCAMGLSALALATELTDQMFDRNFSTGISIMQLLVAQILARFVYLAFNTLFVLFVGIYFLKVPCEGSFWMAYALLLLQTLMGQTQGMFFAALVPRVENLVFVAVGSLLYIVFTGGVFWPLDSIPYFYRWVSVTLPFTLPSRALRSILIRKGAPFMSLILPGFLVTAGWAILFFVGAFVVFRMKYKA